MGGFFQRDFISSTIMPSNGLPTTMGVYLLHVGLSENGLSYPQMAISMGILITIHPLELKVRYFQTNLYKGGWVMILVLEDPSSKIGMEIQKNETWKNGHIKPQISNRIGYRKSIKFAGITPTEGCFIENP